MKGPRAQIAIVLVLTMVCTTVLTGCAHVKGSPAPGPYSSAVKAAAGITSGLTAVQQQNEILYSTIVNSSGKRLLSRDESLAVANAVVTGFQANDGFISCLKSFKAVGATDAQIISDCFKTLAGTLNRIQAGVIANVKDPAAHNALTLAFNSVIDAANIVGQILATQLLTPAPQVLDPQAPVSNFAPRTQSLLELLKPESASVEDSYCRWVAIPNYMSYLCGTLPDAEQKYDLGHAVPSRVPQYIAKLQVGRF